MQLQIMLSNPQKILPSNQNSSLLSLSSPSCNLTNPNFSSISHSPPKFSVTSRRIKLLTSIPMASKITETVQLGLDDSELDRFAIFANELADAAGEVIRQYFRKTFVILDKEDLSPVTIADQAAEEAMLRIIQDNFPSHAIYGEENGWRCRDEIADYVWVLDPIDGTKSFITGKPLFGTLIALLHKGKPVLGIIDQPILRERWVGLSGRKTTLNGQDISTRGCAKLSQAYLYTTSPHLCQWRC